MCYLIHVLHCIRYAVAIVELLLASSRYQNFKSLFVLRRHRVKFYIYIYIYIYIYLYIYMFWRQNTCPRCLFLVALFKLYCMQPHLVLSLRLIHLGACFPVRRA
jgi:hypothetical protein